MFEAAEVGHKVSKKEFEQVASQLRLELLDAQQQLREQARFPVIILVGGVDGAGKGETVNLLNEWMDPRWIITHAYDLPSDEERERPEFWRYWRDLPPKGKIGIFLSSWYSRPILDRVYGRIGQARFDRALERVAGFEQALADDGALILKFWMHLGKKAQEKRFRSLEKDPLQRWRVTKRDWEHWRKYDRFVAAAERAIMHTSTGKAPWQIVEGADPQYRSLAVTTSIRDAIRQHLEQARRQAEARREAKPARKEKPAKKGAVTTRELVSRQTILGALDMSQALAAEAYDRELHEQQGRLAKLARRARERGVSSILVFEGWDAAGKGSAVRRLTAALDARDYHVIPIAAPSDEERAQHYLWRFWRHLSRAGRVTIFDRSWYGRVLVERVEGFATEPEWMRAYGEINQFEEELVRHGIVLLKYWLHITSDEQERRFHARAETPWKSWKLTEEDWRNREKWGPYEQGVNDMVARTSTRVAPWILVEANDKRFARIKIIRSFCDRLAEAVGKK